MTDNVGISIPPSPTWGSFWADLDRTSFPDLLVGRHKKKMRFFSNDSGNFRRVKIPDLEAPEPQREIYDQHNCAWGEANGDGSDDLYCTAGARGGEALGHNRLLISEGSVSFRERARVLGVADPSGRGRSVNWLDIDSDGDLDLFVGNEENAGYPNRLFVNEDGRFSSVISDASLVMGLTSSAVADWDNDGDPDLVTLGHGLMGSRAFRNEDAVLREIQIPQLTGNEWLSATFTHLDEDRWIDLVLVARDRYLFLSNIEGHRFEPLERGSLSAGRMAAPLDVENDGDLDLLMVQGARGDPPKSSAPNHPNVLLLNEGRRGFRERELSSVAGPRRGNGDSATIADYDRDGRQDVHLTNGYLKVPGRSVLLRNMTHGGAAIDVVLLGDDHNPHALGIRIRTSGGSFWRQVTDGVIFRGQSDISRLHIGVGDESLVALKIYWPSGQLDCVDARAGETVETRMGSSPCGGMVTE